MVSGEAIQTAVSTRWFRVSGKITDKHDMSGREWRGVVVWTHFDNQPPESRFLVRIVEIAV